MTFSSCENLDGEIINNFNAKKEYFEILNNYFINYYNDNGSIDSLSFSFSENDNGQIEKIYDGNLYEYVELPENIIKAFSEIKCIFKYDFSYIFINNYRISYGGNGNEMYVFSRDGSKPKYFFSEDEDTNFSVYSLSDNWYYLFLKVR